MPVRVVPVLAATILAAACAESPPPTPATSAPTQDQNMEAFAAMGRAKAAEYQAAEKAAAADEAATQKARADAVTQVAQKNAADREAHCSKTRAVRATSVQLEAAYELKFQKDIEPKMAAIKARCRIPVTKQLGNGRHGVEVQNQEKQTVCKGGPPNGLALDEVTWALHRSEVGPSPQSPISAGEAGSSQDNHTCRELDLALGLDTQVTYGDRAGLEKLLTWKP